MDRQESDNKCQRQSLQVISRGEILHTAQGCLADIGLTDRTTLARKVNHPKPGAAASLGKGAMQL